MSVRKRQWTTKDGPSTVWVVDYRDQDGQRTTEHFNTKREADDRHAEVRVDVNKGTYVSRTKSPTVREAGEAWYLRVKANGMRGTGPAEQTTLAQYRQHLDLHIYPRIGNERVGMFTKTSIDAFGKHLLDTLSRELARKVFTSFKSVLKVAGCLHLANDAAHIGKLKRKIPLEIGKDIPLPEQIKRMIAATETRNLLVYRALVLVAAFAGLRASELRGLIWRSVDFKTATIKVTQRADAKNQIGPCKSVTSQRSIPLDKFTADVLREWKMQTEYSRPDDLVFPNSTGGVRAQRLTLDLLTKVLVDAKLVDRNGEPLYDLRALRHFFASWCINAKENGGRELPTKRVQELMGHATVAITIDTYSHLFPEKSDRADLDQSVVALLG